MEEQSNKINRRQFFRLSAAAAALAAVPVAHLGQADTAQAARPTSDVAVIDALDEDDPITKKWIKLGGVTTMGAATSQVISTPDGTAKYQLFVHGVIVYSQVWGAVLLSTAIFAKWMSLNTKVNGDDQNLLSFVGFPTKDYTPGVIQRADFERGTITYSASLTQAHVIYGYIHVRYLEIEAVAGLPVGEEQSAPNGGRVQSFVSGDIYWKADTGAFIVSGPIRDRWNELGGAGGALGYPVADEGPVKVNGDEVGRSSRFENGIIYYSDGSGAWEISNSALLQAYEGQYSGTSGLLGFPVGGTVYPTDSSSAYQNFQAGVLVWNAEGNTDAGVNMLTDLKLHVQRFNGYGCDNFNCDSQDVYVWVTLSNSDGQQSWQHIFRTPLHGNAESDTYEVNADYDLNIPVLRGELTVDVKFEGWDEDGIFSDDDLLGTVRYTYNVQNLWGISAPQDRRNGDFSATFGTKTNTYIPFDPDPAKFREQHYWSFHNFPTEKLTYDQYANTFSDVSKDEFVLWHLWDKLWYEEAYKGCASGGNCYGMCVEAVYARVGRSLYSQPIHQYFSNTQDGKWLIYADPPHPETINEINIKHGYQMGAPCVEWFLNRFLTGLDHDPVQCFTESRAAYDRGDYPVLALSEKHFQFKGHVVLPYRWDDSNPDQWIIYIADPNHPAPGFADDDPSCFITIDPKANRFVFQHDPSNAWTGDGSSGGRMLYFTYRMFGHVPRTPFAEALILLSGGIWLFFGDATQSGQVTDQRGRTLFEPDVTTPTYWDDMRHDTSKRIPNFTRVQTFDGGGETQPEMYYGKGTAMTYRQQLRSVAGWPLLLGSQREWSMQSGNLSAHVVLPHSADTEDIVTVHGLALPQQAVSITLAANSVPKQATLTVSGPVKHRWIELSKLTMHAEQAIGVHMANGGFDATISNNGPATTAQVRVQSDFGIAPVTMGEIKIGTGVTTLSFGAPNTSLTLAGERNVDGTFAAPVTATLAAVEYTGKGMAYTEYSPDDGQTWHHYGAPIVIGTSGETKLRYRSKDNAGNLESARLQTLFVPAIPTNISQPQQPGVPGQPNEIAPATPTAITLVTFTLQRVSNGVVVRWITGLEANTFGFHLYRGATANRIDAVRVTVDIVVARGGSGSGGTYEWLDTGVGAADPAFYWLAEVETTGSTAEYGPASSLVRSASPLLKRQYLPVINTK